MAVMLLNAVAATGASVSWEPARKDRSLQISGTFVGTVLIQESQDDTTWVTIGTYTAAGLYSWVSAAEYVRANVSAYTSGTITVKLSDKR